MAVAIPWIGLALSAVGTGVAIKGGIDQAKASEEAGEFNAKVAENNAKAEQDRAQFEAQQIRKRNLVMLGKQKSAFAKSGVNLSGSALDVMFDSESQGELDVLAAVYGGNLGANYQRSRGQLARTAGQNAATAARYGAASTALTGLGQGASQYSRMSRRNNPTFED